MASPNPLLSYRPEFADTQPDLRVPSSAAPHPTKLDRIKQHAKPFFIGAGVGAGVALVLAALTSKRKPAPFSLFQEPKSSLFSGLAKVALLALGRTVVRRTLAHTVERAATAPA